MNEAGSNQADAKSTKRATHELRKTEAGDMISGDRVHQAEQTDPAATEAVEHEAADGPGRRGVSR